MKKGIALIAMLMAMVLMLSGCNLIGFDAELDAQQVVAKVNEKTITKGEWKEYLDGMVNYYQQYYAQNGYNVTFTDADKEAMGKDAIDQMIQNIVIEDKQTELNLTPLTEEETKEVEETVDSMMDFYKMIVRYQEFPGIETVEEEAKRLEEEAAARLAAAAATPDEATPDEATPAEAADETATPAEAADAAATPAEAADEEATPDETAAVEAAPEETAAEEPAAEEATAEEATAEEATADEADTTPKATITDAELDAMLIQRLADEYGITREAMLESETASKINQKLHDYVNKDITVTDEQITAEFESKVSAQKTTYDATPTSYATAVNNGATIYYVPEGYRGVKNLLIGYSEEKQTAMDELQKTLDAAQKALDDAQKEIDSLMKEDTSSYDEEALASHNETLEALKATVDENEPIVADTTAKLEALENEAHEEIKATAEEVLAKAKAGEDFDALIETYGTDPGMKSEPAKTRGYLICEGLSLYVEPFQTAAMALEKVGDISELVETDFGYHILQYATDIPAGPVEMTDEMKESISSELLTTAQNAAYEAQVTTWVSEAKVEKFEKAMK